MNPQLPNPLPETPKPGTLDRILLDDTLVPSSGFTASVMDAITAQAAAPAPIPFPWKLALPGLAAFLVALIGAVRLIVQIRHSAASFQIDLSWLTNRPLTTQITQALIAIAGAFLCLLLTRYLAPGRSTR